MQILIGIGAWLTGCTVGAVVIAGIGTIFGQVKGTTLLPIIFILIGVFLASGLHFYKRFIERKQMPAYREQLQEWSNSMVCKRCGYVWIR